MPSSTPLTDKLIAPLRLKSVWAALATIIVAYAAQWGFDWHAETVNGFVGMVVAALVTWHSSRKTTESQINKQIETINQKSPVNVGPLPTVEQMRDISKANQ